MGTWGTAIFSNDLAEDIKIDFRDKIGFGKSPQDATKELIFEYVDQDNDSDEVCVFWIALAAIQWKLGRLQEKVKSKALEIINNGQDLELWENEKDRKKRQLVLEKLKYQLESPQPAPKKIQKPYIKETKMEEGDLLAYKHSSGKIALLRVLGIEIENDKSQIPWIEILDYFEDNIPNLKSAYKLHRKKYFDADWSSGTLLISQAGKRDKEPWNKLEIIKKETKSLDRTIGSVGISWWKEFDNLLNQMFE